jgi:hypothetical protein
MSLVVAVALLLNHSCLWTHTQLSQNIDLHSTLQTLMFAVYTVEFEALYAFTDSVVTQLKI